MQELAYYTHSYSLQSLLDYIIIICRNYLVNLQTFTLGDPVQPEVTMEKLVS